MKKIISLIAAGTAAVLFLASCAGGVTNSDMTLDPKTGKGEKTFIISVPKNDHPGVDNNFGPGAYVPDPEKLRKLFDDTLPDGYTVTLADDKQPTYLLGGAISGGVAATAISTSAVTIQWKRPVSNEIGDIGGYIIQRYAKANAEGDDKYTPSTPVAISSAATLTYTDSSVEAGKTYRYEVFGVVDASAETPVKVMRYSSVTVVTDTPTPTTLSGDPITSNPAKQGDLGYYKYVVKFSFDSIADYNAKLKTMVTEAFWNSYIDAQKTALGEDWEDIKPATLTSETVGGDIRYTFTEDARISDIVAAYAGTICLADKTGAWVDGMGGYYPFKTTEIVTAADGKFTLKMLDQTKTFEYNAEDEYVMSVSVKKAVSSAPSGNGGQSSKPPVENPATGDFSAVPVLVIAAFLTAAAAVLLRKKAEA